MSGLRGNPGAPPSHRLRSDDHQPRLAFEASEGEQAHRNATAQGGGITSGRWGNGVGVPSRGPPPGIRVGRLCHRPLMARPHQLRALLRRLQSGAHGPRLMTQASSSSPTISVAVSAAVSGAYYAICIRSVGFTSHGLHCLDTTYAGFSPLLLLMRVLSPFQVLASCFSCQRVLSLFLPPFLAHTMPSACAAWGSHPTGFAALTLHTRGSLPFCFS